MERNDPLHRRIFAEIFNVAVRILFGDLLLALAALVAVMMALAVGRKLRDHD
jgi:hypothetical protein